MTLMYIERDLRARLARAEKENTELRTALVKATKALMELEVAERRRTEMLGKNAVSYKELTGGGAE